MSEIPDTEDAENWSVFLFDCPKNRIQGLIVMLFNHINETSVNNLPNYTMRLWDEDSIKISFRVLRQSKEKKTIEGFEKSIIELLRNGQARNIIANPTGRNAQISGWSSAPLRKCVAYNRLSEFVMKLAEENLFEFADRNEMRHLAINMLFMREAVIPFACFGDVISGEIAHQPLPSPPSSRSLFLPINIERGQ